MAFEQAYYTSTEVGLRGTKGFQMKAASSGLDESTLTKLERYGLYVPPLSCPVRPTETELEQFPVALSFYRLPDGAAVLSRSTYVGQDYSGRFGNYFTHFLVSRDAGEFTSRLLHLLAWNAGFWKDNDRSSDTRLTLLTDTGATDPAGIEERLRYACELLAGGGYLEQMGNFIACFQNSLQNERRIVIAAPDEVVAMMVGSLALVLPGKLLEKLTFTTYTRNPYNSNVIVCGTAADSDFSFSQVEIQHQYYVFDFFGKRFSVSPGETKFAQTVTLWLRNKKISDILRFRKFLDAHALAVDSLQLDYLVYLYYMKLSTAASLSPREQLDPGFQLPTIRFLIEQRLFRQASLLEIALSALEQITDKAGESDEVARALFQAVVASRDIDPALRDKTINLYIERFVEKIFPNISASQLNSEADFFSRFSAQIPRSTWQHQIDTLKGHIESADDPEWLGAAYDFLKQINFLPQSEDVFIEKLSRTLLPRVKQPNVQMLLGKWFEEGVFAGIDRLVLAELEQSASAGKLLHLLGFLQRPETESKLQRLLSGAKKDDLLLAINALKVSQSTNKGEAALRLLQQFAAGKTAVAPTDLDGFFRTAWPDGMIPPADALTLAGKLSRLALRNQHFLNAAVNGLLEAPDLLTPKSKDATSRMRQVLEEFVKDPSSKRLDPKISERLHLCLKMATWMGDYGSLKSTNLQLESVQEALTALPAKNHAGRNLVMAKALQRFFSMPEKDDDFPQFFKKLGKINESLMLDRLGNYLQEVQKNTPFSVDAFKVLFKFLTEECQKHPNDGLRATIYQEYLRQAYKNLDSKTRKKIDEELSHNQKWEDWRQDEPAIISRVAKFFGFKK